ncbi:MAG: hypothetical protein UEA60_09835 [Lachnospiraceae bacterium]|nr:hypothetical protein [Lachnospiraceae bacterium]
MATLTGREKKNIAELKHKVTTEVLTVAKIQSVTSLEHSLLQEAMDYMVTDKIGNYKGRMSELNKYHYMVQGILYAHLDSAQIRFGDPQPVIITPSPLARQILAEEAIGATPYSSDDETAI